MPLLETTDPQVLAFLRSDATIGHTFLTSVRQWCDDHSDRITSAQEAAVRRIMINDHGWTVNDDDTLTAPDVEPGESNVVTNATHVDLPHIPNGVFTVDCGDYTHRFRIRTITQTATEGLRYKRIMAWYDEDSYEWVNFAYVRTDGRIKVWRRFEDRTSERWQLYANQLMLVLRSEDGRGILRAGRRNLSHVDALTGTWEIEVDEVQCRFCNHVLRVSHMAGHDNCAQRLRHDPQVEAAATPTPSASASAVERDRLRNLRNNYNAMGHAASTTLECHTYSELGSGWEQ
jgi:hypothetical protein